MGLRRTIPAARKGVVVVTALALLAASCGPGWHRRRRLEPGSLAPAQQVQIWSGRTVRRWHAVRVGPDSISGISFLQPTTCDSCRVAVPRATVDSMRLGDPVEGFWKSVGLVVVTTMLALVYVCRRGCIEAWRP